MTPRELARRVLVVVAARRRARRLEAWHAAVLEAAQRRHAHDWDLR